MLLQILEQKIKDLGKSRAGSFSFKMPLHLFSQMLHFLYWQFRVPFSFVSYVEQPALPWSAEEQQLLEQALKTYPNSVSDRWDKIAATVSTRSKKECMKRYKVKVLFFLFYHSCSDGFILTIFQVILFIECVLPL